VASRTLRWVGMPARVHIYVEDACAVVNTGGEEALPSRAGITIRAVRRSRARQSAITWQPIGAALLARSRPSVLLRGRW